MKINVDNDSDNIYSLNNLDNYSINLDDSINDIIKKYCEISNNFLKFIMENLKIKKNVYSRFIIIRGFETITNVFNNILYFTKNLNLTCYHCEKAYYYYVEFIQQITEEQHVFLQLSSRDASTYVYKKTIFEINQVIKKNIPVIERELKNKLELFNKYTSIFKYILETILEKIDLENITLENKIIFIKKIEVINKNLIALKLDFYMLDIFYNCIQLLGNINKKETNHEIYLDIIISLLEKCSKNTNKVFCLIKKNIHNIDLEMICLNEFIPFLTKMKE
jgi:hypothetical protein